MSQRPPDSSKPRSGWVWKRRFHSQNLFWSEIKRVQVAFSRRMTTFVPGKNLGLPTGFSVSKLHGVWPRFTPDRDMSVIESRAPLTEVNRKSAAAVALAFALAGCGATPNPQVGSASAQLNGELGQENFRTNIDGEYRLRASDKITIIVLREPELSLEEVMIAADGTVSLPLTGSVLAARQTTGELQTKLQEELHAAGIKRPMVSVNVVSYGSHVVTVEGGVQEPGVYAFQPGARLSSAIALANGPNRVSKLSEVVVFRPSGNEMTVALFDYQAVRQGEMADPIIEPGDRVVVGISGLSQFWQDLIRALPAFGLFTNINR